MALAQDDVITKAHRLIEHSREVQDSARQSRRWAEELTAQAERLFTQTERIGQHKVATAIRPHKAA